MRSSLIKGVAVEGVRDYRSPVEALLDVSDDTVIEDAEPGEVVFPDSEGEGFPWGEGTDDSHVFSEGEDGRPESGFVGGDARAGLFVKNTEALERLAAEEKERAEKAAAEEERLRLREENIAAEEERLKVEREKVAFLREEGKKELADLQKELFLEIAESREKAKKEAYEESYAKGYEEGKTASLKEFEDITVDAQRELARAREEVQKAVAYLGDAKKKAREILASSERTIVDIAMAVTNKLVRKQLIISPETVLHIVKDTVNSLPDGEHIRVFVNGEDLEICLQHQQEMEEEFRKIRPNFNHIEFVADDSIDRGSCRVESESGVVEFFLEEEKEQLREEMMALARREENAILQEEDVSEDEEQRSDG